MKKEIEISVRQKGGWLVWLDEPVYLPEINTDKPIKAKLIIDIPPRKKMLSEDDIDTAYCETYYDDINLLEHIDAIKEKLFGDTDAN